MKRTTLFAIVCYAAAALIVLTSVSAEAIVRPPDSPNYCGVNPAGPPCYLGSTPTEPPSNRGWHGHRHRPEHRAHQPRLNNHGKIIGYYRSEVRASRSASRGPSAAQWALLRKCESGNRPGAVSRNGLYHGLYQFDRGTWRGVGGHGLPSRASRAEQDKRALILYADRGAAPWPICGKYLR